MWEKLRNMFRRKPIPVSGVAVLLDATNARIYTLQDSVHKLRTELATLKQTLDTMDVQSMLDDSLGRTEHATHSYLTAISANLLTEIRSLRSSLTPPPDSSDAGDCASPKS